MQAYILDSNIDAAGALTLDAVSNQSIHATVIAGSVALSGGVVGASVSGAGAGAENRVAMQVQACMEGDKQGRGISAASVDLNASDNATIESLTGAVSVAAAFGALGASLSIGVGIAHNIVDNDITSYIRDIDASVTTTTGSITLDAHESATIVAQAFAAAAAVGLGGVGIALSGAGVFAGNTILGDVDASAGNSVLESAGDVILQAQNISEIHAATLGISVAVGAGVAAGIGVSIGAAIAGNTITSGVHAYLLDSAVTAAGDLDVRATASQTIDAAVNAVSVAASAGGFAGIGLSGAGASVANSVKADVKAYINGSDPGKDGVGAQGIFADNVTLDARDNSSVDATVGAVSVAIGLGYSGWPFRSESRTPATRSTTTSRLMPRRQRSAPLAI